MPAATRLVLSSAVGFLLVGFVALLGIVGMTFWLGQRAQVYFNEVIEARDTRTAAVELRNAVRTAESSQRGFLYSGNEIYLAPYGSAKALAERQLAALRTNLAPYGEFDILVARLTAILAEKFVEMDETIALKRERRDADAAAIFGSNRGKALMDEANVYLSGAIRAADERLTTGVGEQRANAALLRTVTIIGGLIIVGVVGGAGLSLSRYTRELRDARDEVAALNADLEERVRSRTASLAQMNEEIRRFTHILSHDLRAPLVNIAGFTDEIERGLKSLQIAIDRFSASAGEDAGLSDAGDTATNDLPEAINFIRSATTKMDGLVTAILKLSREGQRLLTPEKLELAEVISESARTLQHQLLEENGALELDIQVPPILHDRLSLEQIFGNLLDNAIKYRARNRPLRINVSARTLAGDRLSIEIADNGRGIDPSDHDRIFDLFARAGPRDQPGEGIGLAYVRTIVRNLGGEIAVSSELGVGTSFRIVLPRELPIGEDLRHSHRRV